VVWSAAEELGWGQRQGYAHLGRGREGRMHESGVVAAQGACRVSEGLVALSSICSSEAVTISACCCALSVLWKRAPSSTSPLALDAPMSDARSAGSRETARSKHAAASLASPVSRSSMPSYTGHRAHTTVVNVGRVHRAPKPAHLLIRNKVVAICVNSKAQRVDCVILLPTLVENEGGKAECRAVKGGLRHDLHGSAIE
jgi:hypothetical protein